MNVYNKLSRLPFATSLERKVKIADWKNELKQHKVIGNNENSIQNKKSLWSMKNKTIYAKYCGRVNLQTIHG